MKKLKYIVLTILLAVLLISFNTFAEENEIRLYLFHSETCPHCKEEIEYLDTIKDDYPNLDIVKYEVSNNSNKSQINKCTIMCVYGYAGANNRVFMAGNPDYPNILMY